METRSEYASAKANITKNQTEADYLIVNGDQQELIDIAGKSKARIILFSTTKDLDAGTCIRNGWVCWNQEQVVKIENIVLPGTHNLENILSAVAAAKLSGVLMKQLRKS